MKIYESAEMYLETLLILSKEKNNIRMVDVAEKMNFSKPSVSVFLKELKNNGYIYSNENGFLFLTDSGRSIAEKIYDRHQSITSFLVKIGVDYKIASTDACKMEHHISDETYECIKKFLNNNQISKY